MKKALSKLSDQELFEFAFTYNRFHSEAYRWDLWEVAFFTAGGCSDDGFIYFRNWLIGRGRHAYTTVLEYPDNLANYPMGKDPALSAQCVEWDMMPGEIWESRDQSRSDDQWYDLFQDEQGEPKEPIGDKFDEEDVEGFRTRFPKLSGLYSDML